MFCYSWYLAWAWAGKTEEIYKFQFSFLNNYLNPASSSIPCNSVFLLNFCRGWEFHLRRKSKFKFRLEAGGVVHHQKGQPDQVTMWDFLPPSVETAIFLKYLHFWEKDRNVLLSSTNISHILLTTSDTPRQPNKPIQTTLRVVPDPPHPSASNFHEYHSDIPPESGAQTLPRHPPDISREHDMPTNAKRHRQTPQDTDMCWQSLQYGAKTLFRHSPLAHPVAPTKEQNKVKSYAEGWS